jgi:hypothetical protein
VRRPRGSAPDRDPDRNRARGGGVPVLAAFRIGRRIIMTAPLSSRCGVTTVILDSTVSRETPRCPTAPINSLPTNWASADLERPVRLTSPPTWDVLGYPSEHFRGVSSKSIRHHRPRCFHHTPRS